MSLSIILILGESVYANFPLYLVHNPADVRQTSFALGVFDGALAIAELFLGLDILYNQRPSMFAQVILDVFLAVLKTIANQFAHKLFSFIN